MFTMARNRSTSQSGNEAPIKRSGDWVLTDPHKAAGILSVEYHDAEQDAFLCKIDLSKPAADTTYQRELDDDHAEALKKRLPVNPYPILSYRGFALRIVEGQHRIAGYKLAEGDNASRLCLVKFGLGVA